MSRELDQQVARIMGWTDVGAPTPSMMGAHPDPNFGRLMVPHFSSVPADTELVKDWLRGREDVDYVGVEWLRAGDGWTCEATVSMWCRTSPTEGVALCLAVVRAFGGEEGEQDAR